MYRGLGDSVMNISARDFLCRGLSPFQWTDYCTQYREHQDLIDPSKAPIAAPPMPPTIGPPPGSQTAPSQADPDATIQAMIVDQERRWQASNQNFMNTQPAAEAGGGQDWTTLALVVAGVSALYAFGGHR